MNSVEQRTAALSNAQTVRLSRSVLKRQILVGDVLVGDVISDVPAFAENMAVYDLLAAQKRWAETRSLDLLNEVGISSLKLVGSLTERQRGEIIKRLSKGAP